MKRTANKIKYMKKPYKPCRPAVPVLPPKKIMKYEDIDISSVCEGFNNERYSYHAQEIIIDISKIQNQNL